MFLLLGVRYRRNNNRNRKKTKELKPNVKIVAVEPESSAVLSGGQAGKHSIQGIGAGFVPDNYDSNTVDKIIQVKDKEAFDMMHRFGRKNEGASCRNIFRCSSFSRC